jgi:hypothetical protein
MSSEKSSDLIENRTHDLLACRTLPQTTTLPSVLLNMYTGCNVYMLRVVHMQVPCFITGAVLLHPISVYRNYFTGPVSAILLTAADSSLLY